MNEKLLWTMTRKLAKDIKAEEDLNALSAELTKL